MDTRGHNGRHASELFQQREGLPEGLSRTFQVYPGGCIRKLEIKSQHAWFGVTG